MTSPAIDLHIAYRVWTDALYAKEAVHIDQLLATVDANVEAGGTVTVSVQDEPAEPLRINDWWGVNELKCSVNKSRTVMKLPPSNLPVKVAPCRECGRSESVVAVQHPGTVYLECQACGHRGPELMPRPDMSLPDEKKRLLIALTCAWNKESRLTTP